MIRSGEGHERDWPWISLEDELVSRVNEIKRQRALQARELLRRLQEREPGDSK